MFSSVITIFNATLIQAPLISHLDYSNVLTPVATHISKKSILYTTGSQNDPLIPLFYDSQYLPVPIQVRE